VQSWDIYDGNSPADALRSWMTRAHLSGAQVRITWSGGKFNFSRNQELADVQPDQQRAKLIEVASDTMGAKAAGAAGIAGQFVPPASGDQGPTVLLVTLPSAALSDLWDAIGDRDWPVVPMMLVPQVDGLHVAVNMGCVACYVVEGGIPRTYAELKVGGLTGLAATLKKTPMELVQRGDVGEGPDRAPLVGYLRGIITEAGTWAYSWISSKQITQPLACWVHGPGAHIGGLSRALADHLGYTNQDPQPRINIVDHSAIPAPDEAQAYLASQMAQVVVPPLTVMPNPIVLAARAQSAARTQRAISMTGLVIAVVAVVGLLAVPIVLAWRQENSAASTLRAAQTQRAAVAAPLAIFQQAQQGQTVMSGIRQVDPNLVWAQHILTSTAPPGARVTSFTMQINGGQIQVSAPAQIISSEPFNAVASWVQSLDKAGATNVQAGTFNYSDLMETLSLQFALPLHQPVPVTTTTPATTATTGRK
jgi:hypothetical protein